MPVHGFDLPLPNQCKMGGNRCFLRVVGQFAALWKGIRWVYLASPSGEQRAYLAKIGPVFELAHAGGKIVFTNQAVQAKLAGLR